MSGFEIGKLTIPIFIGTLLNWAFLGTLFVQVYLYFIAFPQDRRLNKVIVALVFIAEIVQTFSDCKNTINAFGAGWGNRESLDHVGWAWFSVPVLGSTIASVGQVFFAWRISIIGHTLFIPALIVAIAMVQFGAGIWTGVEIVRARKFSLLNFNRLKPPVAWLASTAACDLIIVAATVFFIMKARQTEFKFSNATNIAISRIIKVSVETGLLCAVFAVVDLYLYVAYDGNNYHLATCIWLSKVYSNSIMVILNSRAYIGHAAPQDATRAQITDMVFQSHVGPPTALHVSVDRESTVDSSHARQADSGKIHAGVAV